jgi:hypothetical protein
MYEKGLPLVAKFGSYEPYTIAAQLTEIETHIFNRVTLKNVNELGKSLAAYWEQRGYDKDYPEVLAFFYMWQNKLDNMLGSGYKEKAND